MVDIGALNGCEKPIADINVERALIILENYRRIAKATDKHVKQLNAQYGTKGSIHNISEILAKCDENDELIVQVKQNSQYIAIVHSILRDVRKLQGVGRSRKTQIALHQGEIYYHILNHLYIFGGSPFNGSKMIASIKKEIGIEMAPTTYLKCRKSAIEEFARKTSEIVPA